MDLLDELKDDLKHEQAYKAWQKYGKLLLLAIFLIILAIIISVWLQTNKKSDNESRGDEFFKIGASEIESKSNMLEVQLDKIIKEQGIYYDLALFRKAAILREIGNHQEELEAYRMIFTNKNIDKINRDLAQILYIERLAGDEQNDKLQNLAKLSEESKLAVVAKRVLAGIYLKNKQYQNAYNLYGELANDSRSPEFIRIRSRELKDALEKYYGDKITKPALSSNIKFDEQSNN